MDKLLRKTLIGYIATYLVVFMLTTLLLIPIYTAAYTGARDALERSITDTLSNNVERLAGELHSVDLYAISLMNSDEMVSMAYRPNVNHQHMIDALNLQKTLINMQYSNASIISDIVILFDNSSYVVSTGSVLDRSRYWNHAISIEGMTQEQFERYLLTERVPMFSKRNVDTVRIPLRESAICLNYFSRTRLKTYYAICAIIGEDAMHEVLRESNVDEHGWIRVTNKRGDVLYESRAEGIGQCTEWTFTGSAYPIIVEAGVDNRVFADSVSGVQSMLLFDCALAFVVVTLLSIAMARRLYRPIGEYVRFVNDQQWMNSEVSMQSLRQCIRESTRLFTVNSDVLRQNLEQMRANYRDATLLSLGTDSAQVSPDQLERCFGDVSLLRGDYVAVRLYTGEHGGTVSLDDMNRAYRFAMEQLERYFTSYIVTNPRYLAIIAVDADDMERVDARLEEICEQIAELQVEHHTILRLARSAPHSGLAQLKLALDESGVIVRNLQPFVREGSLLLRYEEHDDVGDAATLSTFYPNQLYSVLLSGKEEAVNEQMRELRKQFTELYLHRTNRAPAFYYNIISVFELVLARLKMEMELREYDSRSTVGETCDYLDGVAQQLGSLAREQARKPDGTDAIIEFLDAHYCDSDLCLSLLSTKFKLSEAYISRMIKLRTGSTYTEYVEQMRMARAAQLLGSSEKSVTDIALELGYETPNTFFKAFKRVYHVSPGAYRDSMEQSE